MGETVKAVTWYSGCTDLHPIPIQFPDTPANTTVIIWDKWGKAFEIEPEKYCLIDKKTKGDEKLLISLNELIEQPDLTEIEKRVLDGLKMSGQVAFLFKDGRRFVREDLISNHQLLFTAIKSIAY